MRSETPFNPLDKQNLGVSVADALLAKAVEPLPPIEPFLGAGIYTIYYTGPYPGYARISERNREGRYESPIYVGKAVPAGARKGGFGLGLNPGAVLSKRIEEHAESVRQANNLEISDFSCKYLVTEDIWIPLAESLLIQMFQPAWNRLIDGFGNHDPGSTRYGQAKSRWDVLHPGRDWANKLRGAHRLEKDILAELDLFLTGRFIPPPQPPVIDDGDSSE
jgi:hypothetical protein